MTMAPGRARSGRPSAAAQWLSRIRLPPVERDTLSGIAQRSLGNGDKWVDLKKPDGTPFTPEEAKNLQVGLNCPRSPAGPIPSWRMTPCPASPSDSSATATSGSTSGNPTAHLHARRGAEPPGRPAVTFPGESYALVAHDTLFQHRPAIPRQRRPLGRPRKPDGTPFTAEEAKNLQVGQLV